MFVAIPDIMGLGSWQTVLVAANLMSLPARLKPHLSMCLLQLTRASL